MARIREVGESEADLAAVAAIVNLVTPEFPTSVEFMRTADGLYPGTVRFVAVEDGAVVGAASVGRYYMHPPDYEAAYAQIAVVPAARRQGVGSGLLREVAAVAARLGKAALDIPVSVERSEGLAFLGRRGFREHRRTKVVRLDLAGLEPPPVDAPPGITVTNLAERPDLVDQVHAVAVEAFADIPGGDEPPAAGDLAEFRARDVDWPTMPKDAFMIALDRASGAVVGYASLVLPPAGPRYADHDMTAVARAWRGRGVATALKKATIGWAIRAGLEYLETGNDDENAPMRAINRRLGFRPQPDIVSMRGALSDIEVAGA